MLSGTDLCNQKDHRTLAVGKHGETESKLASGAVEACKAKAVNNICDSSHFYRKPLYS
jgi:hypothetical protein